MPFPVLLCDISRALATDRSDQSTFDAGSGIQWTVKLAECFGPWESAATAVQTGNQKAIS